jgi:hypothetical protein
MLPCNVGNDDYSAVITIATSAATNKWQRHYGGYDGDDSAHGNGSPDNRPDKNDVITALIALPLSLNHRMSHSVDALHLTEHRVWKCTVFESNTLSIIWHKILVLPVFPSHKIASALSPTFPLITCHTPRCPGHRRVHSLLVGPPVNIFINK